MSGNSTVTLNPGLDSQIKISGSAKVTLNPGIYVIAGSGGFSVSGSASVTGNGVMIYVAGSNYPNPGGSFGSISFSGSSKINLSPASAGTYAGITLFQGATTIGPLLLAEALKRESTDSSMPQVHSLTRRGPTRPSARE